MLQNYIRIAYRGFHKNRIYNLLNLAGLTTGFAAFLFIALYLVHETGFDRFHTKADNIYRLTVHFTSGTGYDTHFARVNADWTKTIPDEIPEVKQLIRFQNNEPKYVRIGEEKFRPDHAYSTDAAVFQVFDFNLLKGDPKTALQEPYSVVLTRSLAQKYFGREDVLGQELVITRYWSADEETYKVTGILEDPPSNTHLPVQMLTSFRNEADRSWWAYTYLLVNDNTDPAALKEKIEDLMAKNEGAQSRQGTEYVLQPLNRIHLHSDLAREIKTNGNILFVKVFSGAAVFILLIVMINFMNLSSVIAIGRAKETGLRKMLGARKNQLVAHALVESVLLSLSAALLACGVVYALLPFIKNAVAMETVLPFRTVAPGMGALALFTGILSGFYPAFILTSLSPLHVMKTGKSLSLAKSGHGFGFRKMLVTGQFTLCMLLIGSAIVARNQFRYLNEKNLGLKKEQVLALTAMPGTATEKFKLFKDELEKKAGPPRSGISGVSACLEVPSREIRDGGSVEYEGMAGTKDDAPYMDIQAIDHDFIDVMGLELLAGERLPKSLGYEPLPDLTAPEAIQEYFSGRRRAYIINETAMRKMGWTDPQEAIGSKIKWSQSGGYALQDGPVTGVVKDFHQETLRNTIDPVVMVFEPLWLRTFLVKLSTDRISESIAAVNETWNRLFPQYPFEYTFVDELYEKLYKSERQQLQLLYALSGLAMIIALLGLFGLVAYSLKTRAREIAIRKIFGADFLRITGMLGKEYVAVVALASAVAIPLSYYFVSMWLESYAYRIVVSWTYYLAAVAVILLIPAATIVYHTLKGISVNPVESLRED